MGKHLPASKLNRTTVNCTFCPVISKPQSCTLVRMTDSPGSGNWGDPFWVCDECRSSLGNYWRYCSTDEYTFEVEYIIKLKSKIPSTFRDLLSLVEV